MIIPCIIYLILKSIMIAMNLNKLMRNKEKYEQIIMKKQFLIKTFFLLLFLLIDHNLLNAMNEHAIISVKSKNYPCTECEKSFINKCNLTRHMHLHTGENLLQCTVCTKQFIYNSNLTTHMR